MRNAKNKKQSTDHHDPDTHFTDKADQNYGYNSRAEICVSLGFHANDVNDSNDRHGECHSLAPNAKNKDLRRRAARHIETSRDAHCSTFGAVETLGEANSRRELSSGFARR